MIKCSPSVKISIFLSPPRSWLASKSIAKLVAMAQANTATASKDIFDNASFFYLGCQYFVMRTSGVQLVEEVRYATKSHAVSYIDIGDHSRKCILRQSEQGHQLR